MINLHKSTEPFEFDDSNWFGYEKPSVLEAFRVLSKEGYYITISGHDYDMRKKRLQKEYEENTKAPGPGEDHPVEKSSSVPHTGLVYDQNFEVERLRQENKDLLKVVEKMKEGNPALKEVSSQFNDALLDEQAKKIEELTKEKTNLEDQITILNAFKEHNENVGRKHIKRLGKEISKLNSIIHDKNAVLSDVAEELRLTKIREKNLAELGLKYVGENEKLKKKLEEKTKLVETVRNASKEYCDYGVAANEFIKKLANLYVIAANKGTISNEMFERCKNYQSYGFPATCNKETKKEIDDIARGKENKKPRIPTPEFSEEELMKLQEKVVASCDVAEEGGDQSSVIIVQCGNGIILSKEEAEIIERCTKNGTELHYSEKDGLTYTNIFGEEIPIRCLHGMFHVFTDEEIKNMKK